MITLKDISKEVGKSITTVSRALNGYDDVSAETKKMIREVANEMGYRPNIIAQRLQKKKLIRSALSFPLLVHVSQIRFSVNFLLGLEIKLRI